MDAVAHLHHAGTPAGEAEDLLDGADVVRRMVWAAGVAFAHADARLAREALAHRGRAERHAARAARSADPTIAVAAIEVADAAGGAVALSRHAVGSHPVDGATADDLEDLATRVAELLQHAPAALVSKDVAAAELCQGLDRALARRAQEVAALTARRLPAEDGARVATAVAMLMDAGAAAAEIGRIALVAATGDLGSPTRRSLPDRVG
jgi:hypothetical protein